MSNVDDGCSALNDTGDSKTVWTPVYIRSSYGTDYPCSAGSKQAATHHCRATTRTPTSPNRPPNPPHCRTTTCTPTSATQLPSYLTLPRLPDRRIANILKPIFNRILRYRLAHLVTTHPSTSATGTDPSPTTTITTPQVTNPRHGHARKVKEERTAEASSRSWRRLAMVSIVVFTALIIVLEVVAQDTCRRHRVGRALGCKSNDLCSRSPHKHSGILQPHGILTRHAEDNCTFHTQLALSNEFHSLGGSPTTNRVGVLHHQPLKHRLAQQGIHPHPGPNIEVTDISSIGVP